MKLWELESKREKIMDNIMYENNYNTLTIRKLLFEYGINSIRDCHYAYLMCESDFEVYSDLEDRIKGINEYVFKEQLLDVVVNGSFIEDADNYTCFALDCDLEELIDKIK